MNDEYIEETQEVIDTVDTEAIDQAVNDNTENTDNIEHDNTETQEASNETEIDKLSKAQKAINKKHFEAQQAKRELEQANARIAEFETKQNEALANQIKEIPELPDPFDDDFEEKVKQRDMLIAQKAQYDAQQAYTLQQQQQQQYAQQQQKAVEIQQKAEIYKENAKKLGISESDLQQAGATVASYGMQEDLAMAILSDADGALITTHLAANPVELSNIVQMNPVQAAMYIEREIKPKAAQLKPKRTNAPAPQQDIKPSRKQESKYKNLSGTKYS